MRSIDGFSRIIVEEHDGELSEKSLGRFQRVRNSARQMGQLVGRLLTFSGLGRRITSYIFEPLHFEQFTEAIRQLALYWMVLNQRPA